MVATKVASTTVDARPTAPKYSVAQIATWMDKRLQYAAGNSLFSH